MNYWFTQNSVRHIYMLSTFLFLGFLITASSHKFYVSITQIDINTETNTLEISTRLFLHDLEEAILEDQEAKLLLGTVKKHKQSDELLLKYFKKCLQLSAGAMLANLGLVGYELEEDIIWVYLESNELGEISNLTIQNTLLQDTFKDQKNIINYKMNGKVRSAICTLAHPEQKIEF